MRLMSAVGKQRELASEFPLPLVQSWVSPLYQSSLEIPSQTRPEMCLLGESKSHQGDNMNQHTGEGF